MFGMGGDKILHPGEKLFFLFSEDDFAFALQYIEAMIVGGFANIHAAFDFPFAKAEEGGIIIAQKADLLILTFIFFQDFLGNQPALLASSRSQPS